MIIASQLPNSPPTFVTLHCAACGLDYSANKGDYFLIDPSDPITCECGFELFITIRRTVYDHDKGREWLQQQCITRNWIGKQRNNGARSGDEIPIQ